MSRVHYDGNLLQPAPFVSVSKQFQKSENGESVGTLFNLTIQGTIVAFKGSPDSAGDFWTVSGSPADETIAANARLKAIIRKEEAIRDLFSNEGKSLEFQSLDGSQPMKCNPRILSVEFPEGTWYDRVPYTIVCEADIVYINGTALGEDDFTEFISSATETWAFETSEDQQEDLEQPRTYRMTHTVEAQGKRFYDETGTLEKEAWQQAQDWVLPKLGFDATVALSAGVNNLPDYYQGLNHVRSENTNKQGGNYSVTESWIVSSGTALETFDVSTVESDNDGTINVSINGQVTGLEERDSDLQLTTSKYDNAVTKFAIVEPLIQGRASSYSGAILHPTPINTTVGRNPNTGTISYNYEYNDRATNFITGAKSEIITINNSWEVDVFASVGVLGRLAGPVLQNLNTKRETTRNLSIELVFGNSYASGQSASDMFNSFNPRLNSPQSTDIQTVVNAANPVLAGALNNIGVAATTAYVSEQNENWNPKGGGRYTYNVSWTYE